MQLFGNRAGGFEILGFQLAVDIHRVAGIPIAARDAGDTRCQGFHCAEGRIIGHRLRREGPGVAHGHRPEAARHTAGAGADRAIDVQQRDAVHRLCAEAVRRTVAEVFVREPDVFDADAHAGRRAAANAESGGRQSSRAEEGAPVHMRLCHGILFVNGMHAKLMVWFAFGLVLARVQCAGFCEERNCTGAPPCHRHHCDSRNERPAPCSHCVVARQAPPSPAAHLAAPTLSFDGIEVVGPAMLPLLSRERARNLPAPSPPGLISLSSVLLRIRTAPLRGALWARLGNVSAALCGVRRVMFWEKKLRLSCIVSVAMCAIGPLAAQGQQSMADMNAPGMFLMGLASGTSANPASYPMPMLMTQVGNWNAMFMGVAFVSGIQQSSPRGGDKLYSTNWFMASAAHIADDGVTLGISHKKIKLEASGFHGAEPGENRWVVQAGPIDSWSARLWFFPAENWAAQVSAGRIAHPEALEPGDQVRMTASLDYTKPMPGGAWSSSLIWGRNHSTATFRDLNSYLAESVLPIRRKNWITGRFELVDKDELFSGQPDIEQQLDVLYGSTFRIGAYTIGYTRDIDLSRHIQAGVGANFTAYSLPDAIKRYYGNHPAGGNIFVRFRLRGAP